jgi:hypothetical protein
VSTSYADSAQARALDERMSGTSDSGPADNWFDYGPDPGQQFRKAAEGRRLAALPGRLRIAMGQMEAVLAKQGGSV